MSIERWSVIAEKSNNGVNHLLNSAICALLIGQLLCTVHVQHGAWLMPIMHDLS